MCAPFVMCDGCNVGTLDTCGEDVIFTIILSLLCADQPREDKWTDGGLEIVRHSSGTGFGECGHLARRTTSLQFI